MNAEHVTDSRATDAVGTPPTFSIVVPTFNRSRQLSRCLSALARQEYPKDLFEVIVVDDGGAEDLTSILDSFGSQLRLRHLRQANAGPAAARNHGAALAVEQFLAFTDDDCAPLPDWLSRFAKVLARDPNVLVGGTTRNALEANPFAAASQLILDVVNQHFNRDHQRAQFFPSDNIALSRTQFLELGGFDTEFRWSEDRDFCDRWLSQGRRIVFAPEAEVDHSREMGLIGFIKQHFGYGRGAWRFHRVREARNTGSLQVEGSFYSKCFVEPFKTRSIGSAVVLAGVLLVWQLANAAGFFYEALRHLSVNRTGHRAAPVRATNLVQKNDPA
jgi:glycosyltransferase involved in cell wall biosynthesis